MWWKSMLIYRTAVTVLISLLGGYSALAQGGGQPTLQGTATVTNTTSTQLIPAPGANVYIYISHLSCYNSGSTGVSVSFQNGSGGTTIWEGYAIANGGFVEDFAAIQIGGHAMTANTALYFAAGGSTTSLICNAAGLSAP
jgi:hypothetical protein